MNTDTRDKSVQLFMRVEQQEKEISDLKDQLHRRNALIKKLRENNKMQYLALESFCDWVSGFQFEEWYPKDLVKEIKELVNR
jgi:hypothetical protein